MKLWSLAWRNLLRHARRNLTTGLAIALGFAGVVLLGGYMMRMENYLATQGIYLNHVGQLAVYKKHGLDRHLIEPEKFSLSPSQQDTITETAKTLSYPPEFFGRYLRGQAMVTNGCSSFPVLITALDAEAELKIRSHKKVLQWTPELLKLKRGHGFWEPDASNDSVVIAYRLANLLKKPIVAKDSGEDASLMSELITDCTETKAKDSIQKHSGIQFYGSSFYGGVAGVDARIAGHYSTGLALSDASQVLLPLALAQDFYQTDKVTWVSLFFEDNSTALLAASELRRKLNTAGDKFEVYTYRDDRVNPYYVGAMNFVYVMMAFFAVLVCGVVALSILNSLQISLLERKVELGTLRAIGFRKAMVTKIFVREVVLLCWISLSAGALFAVLISNLVNSLNLRFELVGTADDIQFVLKPELGFTLLIGIVFLGVAALTCKLECNRRLKAEVVTLLENA